MVAATLWGVSGVVAKALFNRRIEPWTLVEIRLTASFLTLLVILTLRGHPLRVPRDLLGRLALLGLAMTSAQFTYYLTISLTGVSTALFLQYTAPVFVALYAWAAKGEAITPLRGGAILLAVTGSYFLVTGGAGVPLHPPRPAPGGAVARGVLGAIQITGGLAIVAAVVLIQVSDLFAARRVVLPSALD